MTEIIEATAEEVFAHRLVDGAFDNIENPALKLAFAEAMLTTAVAYIAAVEGREAGARKVTALTESLIRPETSGNA